MTTLKHTLASVLVLTALASSSALAVAEESQLPDEAVNEALSIDTRAKASSADPIADRKLRFAEAQKRAEQVLSLPPDKVSAFVAGTLTDSSLKQERTPADTGETKQEQAALPSARLWRLLAAGLAALALGIWVRRQRAQAKAEEALSLSDQDARGRHGRVHTIAHESDSNP